jgi:hypothetical protein
MRLGSVQLIDSQGYHTRLDRLTLSHVPPWRILSGEMPNSRLYLLLNFGDHPVSVVAIGWLLLQGGKGSK